MSMPALEPLSPLDMKQKMPKEEVGNSKILERTVSTLDIEGKS